MHQRSPHSFRTRKPASAHITLHIPPHGHRHLGAFLHLGKFMAKCHAGAEPPRSVEALQFIPFLLGVALETYGIQL